MIRLVARVGALIWIFSVLLAGVRIVGGTAQSPVLAVLDSGSCAQPCWHGIRLGQTTLDQARAVLQAAGIPGLIASESTRLCWHLSFGGAWRACIQQPRLSDSSVRSLSLTSMGGTLRLGDAILLFGEPVNPVVCWTNGRVAAYVPFHHNIVVRASAPLGERAVFDQNMIIDTIYYYAPDALSYDGSPAHWEGFTRRIPVRPCGISGVN